MSAVYRKTLKGIDEAAFNSSGLPARLVNYLMVVDGKTSADELQLANPHLPSLAIVCDGLREQGFLEIMEGSAANAGHGRSRSTASQAFAAIQ